MPVKQFKRDLILGNKGEALLQTVLAAADIESEQNLDQQKIKDYDIKARLENREFTFEVKFDMYAARSGNIAIEFYNPKSNIPTGIDATKADLWVHIITKPMSVWATSVKNLREYIINNKPHRVVSLAGDENASLYLYKQDLILPAVFYRIDERTGEDLVKILLKLLLEERV